MVTKVSLDGKITALISSIASNMLGSVLVAIFNKCDFNLWVLWKNKWNALCPKGQTRRLVALFSDNFGPSHISDTDAALLHSFFLWPVSLWQARSRDATSHSRARPLITDPVPNISFKSLKTQETQSNMILRLQSETFRGSRQMSHAFLPFCAFPFTPSLPLWSLQTRSLHADLCISLHCPLLWGLWVMCHKHLVGRMRTVPQTRRWEMKIRWQLMTMCFKKQGGLAFYVIYMQRLNRYLPTYSHQSVAFFMSSVHTKLLNREADEVECRSRLHTTGSDLSREKSSFWLLFFPLSLSPWPAETDVTIGFRIASHFQGTTEKGKGRGGAAEAEEGKNLCRSQCVCQFGVSVSFERMRDDCCCDSSPEWRIKGMKRYSALQPGQRTGKRLERDG